MEKVLQEYSILINPISKPLQIAIYRDKVLEETKEIDGYASDYLVEELINLIKTKESIKEIIYVNGPGSQMGIKLAYIALKTIEMLKNIPLKSCSAFELNGGKPIKAMGKLFFIKEKENIITKKIENKVEQSFIIPKSLLDISISDNTLPDYRLPAV